MVEAAADWNHHEKYSAVDVQHPLLACEKLLISIEGFATETKTAEWLELHRGEDGQ